MTFKFDEKDIFVNINEVFEIASDEDYIDDLDAVGVVIHNLSHYSYFKGYTVILFYNDVTDEITVEINSEDNYEVIRKIHMLPKEKDLIKKKLAI